MSYSSVFAAACVVLGASAGQAAVITTYTNRAAFNAAASPLGPIQFEGFEGLPTGPLPLGTSQLNQLTLTVTQVTPTTLTNGSVIATAITGTRALSLNADTFFRTLDLSFGGPVFAVGFDYTGASTGGEAALRVDGQLFVFGPLTPTGNGFFGFVSDTPIASFSFEDASPGLPTEIFTSDNYAFVLASTPPTAAVPEPTSLGLAAGAAAVGALVWRRKRLPAGCGRA